MIGLARLMARTPFGIGLAVGIVLSFCIAPLAESRAATNPPCNGQMVVPPEVQAWIDLQCSIRQATFGDAADPGACYKFENPVASVGRHHGTTFRAEAIEFDAVYVIPLDLKRHAPELATQGVEASVVVGRLAGPAGKIAISGMVILPTGITQDTGHLLVVNAVLSTAELDTYAVAARIQAGVRVVNSTTGQSRPLAEVESANSMWGFPSDPSTLYSGNEAGTGGGVNMDCVELAFDRHDERMKTAAENAALCMKIVLAAFAGCMALCVAVSIVLGPLGAAGFILCVGTCLVGSATATYLCTQSLEIAINSSFRQLLIDLRACGVIIAEA